MNLARRRFDEFNDRTTESCLATPTFANEAERFTRRHYETHTINSFDELGGLPKRPVPDGKMNLQISYA